MTETTYSSDTQIWQILLLNITNTVELEVNVKMLEFDPLFSDHCPIKGQKRELFIDQTIQIDVLREHM